MHELRRYILLSILLFVFACHSSAKELRLVFENPVELSEPSREGLKNKTPVAAGKDVIISTEKAYWIRSKGKIPVMIIPVSSDIDETLQVNLTDVATWPPHQVEKAIDEKLSAMMNLMTQFQIALTKKDLKSAERLMVQMTNLKDIPSLNFLRAYLAFMKGDMNLAKSTVKRGLRRYPAHVQGRQLLQALGGDKK